VTAVLRIEPRWTDLDPVGHVNNNVFLVYAEEARARFLHAALPDTWSSIVVVHNATRPWTEGERAVLEDLLAAAERSKADAPQA
jgi:Thioesterase-like superfamily